MYSNYKKIINLYIYIFPVKRKQVRYIDDYLLLHKHIVCVTKKNSISFF